MEEYAIFRGLPQMKPFQLGLVSDLSRAIDLMNRMNERIAGSYFVRNLATGLVVASLHSREISGASGKEAEAEPSFDIFRGVPDKNAIWYETVAGLATARERMERIASVRPGSYFVFSRGDHSVLARIETLPATQKEAGSDSEVA